MTDFEVHAYGSGQYMDPSANVEVRLDDGIDLSGDFNTLRVTPEVAVNSHAASPLDTAAPVYKIDIQGHHNTTKWRNA
jgi:hypothetical protein